MYPKKFARELRLNTLFKMHKTLTDEAIKNIDNDDIVRILTKKLQAIELELRVIALLDKLEKLENGVTTNI